MEVESHQSGDTLKGLVEDPDAQDTNIWILDANRTETDILARTQLEELIESRSNIKLWHILSSKDVKEDWAMGRGRVSLDCLRKHLPPPPAPVDEEKGEMEDTIALLCGPPAMENAILEQLKEIGWNTDRSVVALLDSRPFWLLSSSSLYITI